MLLRSPYFWAAIVAMVTLPLIRPLFRHIPDPPPVSGRLPTFALIDQRGRPFGLADLEGRVQIVDFFSTTGALDPTRAMHTLQRRLKQHRLPIRLISITVDPGDTPPLLARYARAHDADPHRWSFLTGPGLQLQRLAAVHRPGRFLIVDGDGGIRGQYHPDKMGLDEMFHRSQHVLRDQRR